MGTKALFLKPDPITATPPAQLSLSCIKQPCPNKHPQMREKVAWAREREKREREVERERRDCIVEYPLPLHTHTSDGCPKNWYGIACSSGRVTSIALNDLGLIGEFDFLAVSSLQMLQNLSLSNNQFSGAIAKEIGSIQSLQNLDFSRNSFAGSIPSELTALENLVALNVSSNEMVGEIPSGFGSLKKLKFLDFHSNGFVGDVMGILGQLGDVAYVDLSVNRFSGSLDLGAGNPDFISSVNYLNVSHNNLSGELFPHDGIPYFDSLEVFDASDNGFLGNLPSFSFVVSLRVIKLGNNQLSGSLPEGLLQESSMILSELDLSHNRLEGPIGSISSENLRNLNLSSNRLSGPLPIRIGHCAVIDLSNNMFSGNLSRIQSWGNYIEIIDLSSNKLTGSLPNQTSQFLRLTSLRISNNSLEGVLTPVLGTYPELENVDFSVNKLTGSLPPILFTSTKLTDVNLSSNNFSGTIPISDASGPPQNYSLASLDLSNNELTGILPDELGRFRSIVFLDLSKNLLDGGIPNGLPETMKGFNVSYNNLSGVVPQSLQRFTSSSFRPGNYYLTLPNEASSTKGGPTDSRTTPPLSLADRLKIAVDVSGCLTYLHTESTIPHGNLKSTNILIEFPDINVLLTDYTLHRLLTPSGISEQVLNAAALGYLPPEFTTTSKPCPSLKSDVYAFGVVLLELLTGRSSADIIPGTHEVVDLSEWVGSMAAEDRAFECFDRAFVGPQQVVTESVGRNLDLMLCVALKCVLPADERPDMK
ncbi:hypothetical protein MIMGU_mgv1a021777mg, partial [Erythranthe guttata]